MLVDCFMYSGELNALMIRLNELNDIVDKFVIVEGTRTFRGERKELYLDNHWDILKPWHDRIHRVVVEHYPKTKDPWVLEHFQRDQISRGLEELNVPQEARIIVSDADEVPRASAVEKLNLWGGAVHLDMNTYYLCLDWKVPDRWNQGGRPFVAIRVQMGSAQQMRDDQRRLVLDGAWHFSYLGGARAVQEKIKAFSHSEYDTPEFTDLEHLEHCKRVGMDMFDRFALEPVEVDETYPQWVRDNVDDMGDLLRSKL